MLALLLLAQIMAGCDSPTPVGPSSPESPQVSTPSLPVPLPRGVLRAAGSVSDTAFRPLAGARVEVVDGADAGMVTIADATGRFSLTGRFDDTTQFRATQGDHVAGIKTLAPCCPVTRALYFFLAVPAASVSLAGDYTLTVAADAACTDLPEEVRTRRHTATLASSSAVGIPANSWYGVTFADSPFLTNYGSFLIGVAGDYLAFNLEESEGPYLVEELAPNSYVAIGGLASTTANPASSTISASLEGTIEYCELRSPMGPYYSCIAPVARARCVSNNHRLTLTRR